MSAANVLAFYDVTKPTTASADDSSYGISGMLLQQHVQKWKPIACCSRNLTAAEQRYANPEKDCLAGVWACDMFDRFLGGLGQFKLLTNHTSRALDQQQGPGQHPIEVPAHSREIDAVQRQDGVFAREDYSRVIFSIVESSQRSIRVINRRRCQPPCPPH